MVDQPKEFFFPKRVDVNPLNEVRDDIEEDVKRLIRAQGYAPKKDLVIETYREQIAHLIRLLTYRELKQVADELYKCAPACDDPKDWNIAQTLDDWAHMVKEEWEGDHDTQGPETDRAKKTYID